MAIWAGFNGRHGFDPYPFILLNLFLSMIAGPQGASLLISARRAVSISSEVALHTLDNTAQLRKPIQANTTLWKRRRGAVVRRRAFVRVGRDWARDALHRCTP